VETQIIVGLISLGVAALGILAALLGRKKEIIHRHINEQPVKKPSATVGRRHSEQSERNLAIACVHQGVTYYGIITQHDLTSFLAEVIAGKSNVDIANYWWALLWDRNNNALPPAWGIKGGSTSVCVGPCTLNPKCPKKLYSQYDGATNVKVDYVVSETDANASQKLLQKLGSATVPDDTDI